MTVAQTILSYFVIWSLCVFLTLPFGIRPNRNPALLEAQGAPEQAHYMRKIIIAGILAIFFTALLYFVIASKIVSFEE